MTTASRVPPRMLNVTEEIRHNHRIYGSSDNTAQHSTAASKSLNYANGASIQHAWEMGIYSLPKVDKWEDAVGLFGAENKFIKYTPDPRIEYANSCFEDDSYECAQLEQDPVPDSDYLPIDYDNREFPTEETYEELRISANAIPHYHDTDLYSVEIINHGVDNIYMDDWLDVRLYNKNWDEHPFTKMWLPLTEPFYVGFHARNTKRLSYDVDILIGKKILPASAIKNKQEIRKLLVFGNQY